MKHYSREYSKTSILYPSATSQWDRKMLRQKKWIGRSIYQRNLGSILRTTLRDIPINKYQQRKTEERYYAR